MAVQATKMVRSCIEDRRVLRHCNDQSSQISITVVRTSSSDRRSSPAEICELELSH